MPVHFVSERSLKVRRLLREQEQAGAFELPVPPQVSCPRIDDRFAIRGSAALTIYATRNPGVSQDFTGLVAAVQLRLRVAIGLQALQRCSGLLNRRARGGSVATHHFKCGARNRFKQTVGPPPPFCTPRSLCFRSSKHQSAAANIVAAVRVRLPANNAGAVQGMKDPRTAAGLGGNDNCRFRRRSDARARERNGRLNRRKFPRLPFIRHA